MPKPSGKVLIAEELRGLLPEVPIPGYAVTWFSADRALGTGQHEALIPLLSRRIGERELSELPRLRIIANCAVGVDNIDLVAAAGRGIVVTNTPDVLTESTADLTWALILAVARRLKEGADLVARNEWKGWHPTQLLGLEMRGSTLGIIGAGRIGSAVARRALGFGTRVQYSAPRRKPAFEREVGAAHLALEDLLAESDIVTLHVPSTSETRQMIGARELQGIKQGAILVNTARGDLIDQPALVEALDGGHLGGVGLDVFDGEPFVPRALVAHPRAVVVPHIGSATTVTRRAMAELAVRNASAVLSGRSPITPVTD